MSLEQALAANTEALNNVAALLAAANLAALGQLPADPAAASPNPPGAVGKGKEKPALPPKQQAEAEQRARPAAAAAAPTETKPAAEATEITYDMAKAALLAVVKKKGSATAAAILGECGLKTLSDEGAAAKYAEAHAKLTAALEAQD